MLCVDIDPAIWSSMTSKEKAHTDLCRYLKTIERDSAELGTQSAAGMDQEENSRIYVEDKSKGVRDSRDLLTFISEPGPSVGQQVSLQFVKDPHIIPLPPSIAEVLDQMICLASQFVYISEFCASYETRGFSGPSIIVIRFGRASSGSDLALIISTK